MLNVEQYLWSDLISKISFERLNSAQSRSKLITPLFENKNVLVRIYLHMRAKACCLWTKVL